MAKPLTLKELQSGFAAQAMPVTGAAPAALADCVIGNGIAPAARLRVHANNTRLTLTDALAKTFPVVATLTGADFFAALAAHYMEAEPPKSAALIDWGASLPAFIQTFEPAQALPYLADMARLEWAVNESFHAADSAPASVEVLQTIAPAALAQSPMPLHSAAQVLKADWPVDDIWAAHQPDGPPLDQVAMVEGAYQILVTRPQLGVFVHRLEDAAAHLARLLNTGAALGLTLEESGAEGAPAFAHLLSIGALAQPMPAQPNIEGE